MESATFFFSSSSFSHPVCLSGVQRPFLPQGLQSSLLAMDCCRRASSPFRPLAPSPRCCASSSLLAPAAAAKSPRSSSTFCWPVTGPAVAAFLRSLYFSSFVDAAAAPPPAGGGLLSAPRFCLAFSLPLRIPSPPPSLPAPPSGAPPSTIHPAVGRCCCFCPFSVLSSKLILRYLRSPQLRAAPARPSLSPSSFILASSPPSPQQPCSSTAAA